MRENSTIVVLVYLCNGLQYRAIYARDRELESWRAGGPLACLHARGDILAWYDIPTSERYARMACLRGVCSPAVMQYFNR